ncbi:hypothetical protein [Paenibacillus sp. OK076]|uniref:hypothetical protein n=1 Tax=Paenibacillus sp. OK076 TaxID=1884379 RepID=UPI0008B930F9|nr:hypothetical protein [Paenibacillus sp. OK076]SEO11897.1 hypothetical protein SAMN05518670_3676 [Paenibacillus sp. OK076]
MRRITFSRNKGVGYRPYPKTFEFEDNVTEEINLAYQDSVWQEARDEFTWYEEE